jgi:hypothetical protein
MREIDRKMHRAFKQLNIKVGDIYESCSYHPVLCLGVDYKKDSVWGVSLIDGTYPRDCSLVHCGVRKLSAKEAWQIKMRGPSDVEVRNNFSPERRWWNARTEQTLEEWKVSFSGPRAMRRPNASTSPSPVKRAKSEKP